MTVPHFDLHPDNEQLSASLDGEADADVVAHVAGCDQCSHHVDRLQIAVAAVAAPVPPAAQWWTNAAISAAVATAPELEPSNVVPLAPRRRAVPPWVLGTAAATIAVLLAVPVLGSLNRGGGARKASTAASESAAGDSAASTNGGLAPGGAATGERDLGDVAEVLQLTALVRADLTAEVESAAPTAAPCQVAAATAAVPDAASPPVLAYRGRLRWREVPATVFGFRDVRAPDGLRLVVTADSDCEVLVTASA